MLSIVGATRRDVDIAGFSRTEFPTTLLRNIGGVRWFREKYRKYVEGRTRRYMPPEFKRNNTPRIEDIVNIPKCRRWSGFRDDAHVYFYNHHESHALAPLFHTQWDEALLVTADAGGDTVNYSQRHFAKGTLTTIYGGEECLLTPLPVDSLGHAYMAMTASLGFTPIRHEGKLTGLAAFGQPVLADRIAARFSVDDAGRVFSDFRTYPEMVTFIRDLAAGVSREDASASIQQVLEDTMLRSVKRLLQRHKARYLGVAGGVFANVRLNRVLADRLPIEEIFIYPAMGDEGMPAGGALCYLLQHAVSSQARRQHLDRRHGAPAKSGAAAVPLKAATSVVRQRGAEGPIALFRTAEKQLVIRLPRNTSADAATQFVTSQKFLA